jgi:kynurenine formamidase
MRPELLAFQHARVVDLGQSLERGMPQSPNHPPFRMVLERRHGDMRRPDGGSAASELIITGGHVGTHIDAFCHVSHDGLLADGIDAQGAVVNGRFSQFGVETIAPIVRRGVLLDVAGASGVDVLEDGSAITAADLERVCEQQGTEVRAGDAVLVRTGWPKHWKDVPRFQGQVTGVPGPDESAGRWLAERGAGYVGSDTIAFEQIPPGRGHSVLPVHHLLLVERKIHIIELLYLEELARDRLYEFLFVALPLKIVGATGSPVRPVALV